MEWSDIKFTFTLAVVASIFHHFLMQYPYQAKLLNTIFVFTATDVVFLNLYLRKEALSYVDVLANLFAFFCIQVRTSR